MEKIKLPSLYFSHDRLCFKRDGSVLAFYDFMKLRETEKPEMMRIRFRTIGDITCTGAVFSEAMTLGRSDSRSCSFKADRKRNKS
jgi:sulfate adenylyltransferase subunit 2